MSAGIYRITNLITSEVYVGYSFNLKNRRSDYKGIRVKSQPLINASLEKYGFENHKFDVLFNFEEIIPTTRELKQFESMFIRYYKYWKGCTMLNTNEGGGGSGKWSDKKKKEKSTERRGFRKRAVLQYDFNGVFIKRWDSIQQVSKELSLDYNLMIRCLKGIANAKSVGEFQWKYDHKDQERKLGQYDLNDNLIRVWNNSAEFLRSVGKPSKNKLILDVCNGTPRKRMLNGKMQISIPRRAYGYKWKFIESVIDNNYENIEPYDKSVTGFKPILQYDLKGNFIKEWDSFKSAKTTLGLNNNDLYNSLNDIRNKKFSRKERQYQWRYKIGNAIPQKIEEHSGTPVVAQYTLDGKLIKVWINLTSIEKEIGITKDTIGRVLKGQQKKAKGFQWRRLLSSEVSEQIDSIAKEIVVDKTKVLQFGMDGKFIKAWDYMSLATHAMGIHCGAISGAINGKLKSAGGFQWRIGEPENVADLPPLRVIHQFTRDGAFVREWNSAKEIVKSTGYAQGNISSSITGRKEHAYGFVWKYKI